LISVLQPEIVEQLTQELHLLQPEEFKQLVAPVYLRRNRKDVLGELPELEIVPQWLRFGVEEEKQYHQAVKAERLMLMRRAAWLGGSPEKSPKLDRLLEICMEASENGQKVLVFSFFRDVIKTIHKHLRSEEHTSELQSRFEIVCRLLLEKKNNIPYPEKRMNIPNL